MSGVCVGDLLKTTTTNRLLSSKTDTQTSWLMEFTGRCKDGASPETSLCKEIAAVDHICMKDAGLSTNTYQLLAKP